jgi:two-component system response regulator PilR (NtrC family)
MGNRVAAIAVLSVSPSRRDHEYLESILGQSRWRLHCATSCQEAWKILHETPIDAIITERSFPGGLSWRHLVEEAAAMKEVLPVIVTARAIDDSFWMEVLSAGAFDLLTKPLDPDEVRRVVSLAWRSAQDARALKAACRPRATSAAM